MDRAIAVLTYKDKEYAICLREDHSSWNCEKNCYFSGTCCSGEEEVGDFCTKITDALEKGRRFHFEEVRDG